MMLLRILDAPFLQDQTLMAHTIRERAHIFCLRNH